MVVLVCCDRPLTSVTGCWKWCITTMSQADFSPRCRENLAGQQPARLADWRLDHNLRTACKADVPQLCSDALQAKEPQVQCA